jgi:two-component system cell cycle sensor histidine kinase/response regulator CckA
MSFRILVLEDNETARFVFRAVLEPVGYTVVDVEDETEAIQMFASPDERFDLLVADVVLRAAYGADTARRLAKMRPDVPILFTSGFPLATLLNRGLLAPDQLPSRKTAFLEKPFKAAELVDRVRELIAA